MRNITDSSVKFFDLRDALLAKFRFIGSYFSISPSKINWEGFSKLNCKFAVPLFYDQIRKDLSTNVEKSMACNDPFITSSSMGFVSRFFKSGAASAFKSLLQPVKEPNIGIGNLQNGSIMSVFVAVARFVFKLASMKTSFTVDNSSKVGKMKWIVDFLFIKNSVFMIDVIEFHGISYVHKFTN